MRDDVELEHQLRDAVATGETVMWPYRIEWRVRRACDAQNSATSSIFGFGLDGAMYVTECHVIDCRTDLSVQAFKDAEVATDHARKLNDEWWANA